MSFLNNQNENPDFLNFYLKYSRFILMYADTTVNELYNDIKTFLRYLIIQNNKEKYSKLGIDEIKDISIKDITLNELNDVKPFIINDYLFYLRGTLGNNAKTRNRKLSSLKKFFKYLSDNNLISNNPTIFAEYANTEKRLPKYLNLNESKALLSNTINANTRNSIRDYAIECIFLNCCLRLSELININIYDLKLDDKTLKVKGKGNKERIIYLNEAVCEAIQEYIKIRPKLTKNNPDYNALFLSERKKRISRRNVQLITENSVKKTFDNQKSDIHTHSLRHTGATLMHNENNVNILIIQKILGHKHLSSTEIYTHVTNKKMKEIMENCTISSILEKREENNNENK